MLALLPTVAKAETARMAAQAAHNNQTTVLVIQVQNLAGAGAAQGMVSAATIAWARAAAVAVMRRGHMLQGLTW